MLRPHDPAPERSEPHSIRGLTCLGLVVNPRDKCPLLVTSDRQNVGIRSLNRRPAPGRVDNEYVPSLFFRHGSGYYDTQGHGESKTAEVATGYPRVHTPHGVKPIGFGYGTSLYSSLALGAYLTDQRAVKISMDVTGDGISSEGTRSSSADEWWDSAVKRGLARREETEGEESCEEFVELEGIDPDAIERIYPVESNQRITYVNTVSVDMCTGGESLVVDSMGYSDDVWSANLVIAELVLPIPKDIRPGSEMRYIVEQMMDDEYDARDVNYKALLALDVMELDEEAIKVLSLLYAAEGLEAEIDSLWYRWEHALDPGEKTPQLRLTPNQHRASGARSVLDARAAVGWERWEDLP